MPERLSISGQPSGASRSYHSFVPIAAGLVVALVGLLLALIAWARTGRSPAELRSDARAAASAGRWQQAESILSRIDRLDPEDWLLRAVVAHEQKDDNAAAEYLCRVPPNGPLASKAALARGQVERARFHARAMEVALLKALEIDPSLMEARRLLVYLYGTQNRRAELIEQFARLLEDGPVTFELVNHSCLSHFESITDVASVKADLERFVANDPEDRTSRIALANSHRMLGEFDRASAVLESLADSDPEVRAVRAETELDRGNLTTAAALLKDGPKDHAKLALLRGRVAVSRGDLPAAVGFFRIADSAWPNNRTTLYALGQALSRTGDSSSAEVAVRKAGRLQDVHDQLGRVREGNETKAQIARRLAALCESARLLPEARAFYRLAIAADPLDSEAQRGLFRLPIRATVPEPPGRVKPN
jgi:tetratricopeptide (TPR) repeat protein